MTSLRKLFTLAATTAIITSTFAVAANADEHTLRLVEKADGTLAIEHGASLSFFGDTVLAETTAKEEAPTFIPEQPAITDTGIASVPTTAPSSVTSNDPLRPLQWGLDALHVDELSGHKNGQGITVAVLDTGIDASHPDFEGRVTHGYTAQGASVGDKHGHGTHVAGIIGAGTNNSIGVAGIAPDVNIWDGKITFDNGSGNTTIMAEGIIAAINADVDVISISMTSYKPASILEAAIDQAVKHGIPVVAAAGNDGAKGSPKAWPAAYDQVIAVGAEDRNGELAWFSNTNDYIDVTAPGNAIYSLAPNNGTMAMNGTSQATPMVSAMFALLKSADHGLKGDALTSLVTGHANGKAMNPVSTFASLPKVAPVVEETPVVQDVAPVVEETLVVEETPVVEKTPVTQKAPAPKETATREEDQAPRFHTFNRLRGFDNVIR